MSGFLRFVNARAIDADSVLSPHQLAQVPVLGVALDGEALPFAERLEAEFFDPALCEVVDDAGVVRFEVWTTSDAGGVFRGGTAELVAPISQGGFGAPDLECWAALALATPLAGSAAARVSWAVSSEGGPVLHAIDEAVSSLPRREGVRIGEAWPALVEALRPFDDSGRLLKFLLGAGGTKRDGLKGMFGPAGCFDAASLVQLADTFAKVPGDAVEQLASPLEALARYGISAGQGVDVPWLVTQLDRMRAFVVDAAAAGKGAAVVIS